MKVYIKWLSESHTYTMTVHVSDYKTEMQSYESLKNWLKFNGSKYEGWHFVDSDISKYGAEYNIVRIIEKHFKK